MLLVIGIWWLMVRRRPRHELRKAGLGAGGSESMEGAVEMEVVAYE